jgi:hypothetical protein
MYFGGIRVRCRVLNGKLDSALVFLVRIFENNAHGYGVAEDGK